MVLCCIVLHPRPVVSKHKSSGKDPLQRINFCAPINLFSRSLCPFLLPFPRAPPMTYLNAHARKNAPSSAARAATHASATTGPATAATAGSETSIPGTADDQAVPTTAAATLAAPKLAERPRRGVAVDQPTSATASSTISPVSALAHRAPVAEPVRRSSDTDDDNEASIFAGMGTTWFPVALNPSEATSTSVGESEEDGSSGRGDGAVSGVEGISEVAASWPLSGGIIGRELGIPASAVQSEASSSDPGSRALSRGTSASSSEGPPDLMSSSGDSGMFSLQMSASEEEGPPGLVSSSGER